MQSSEEQRLACITCGPAYEPVDHVRRITNFSTGEIGTLLSATFLAQGFEVICFRGEGATYPPPGCADVRSFSTNASLVKGLRELKSQPSVILHAAALSDFLVAKIEGASGSKKLRRRGDSVRLTLRPAEKILPQLRGWFPQALIIGWKYELDGSREESIAQGAAQIREARTDACVINGAAFRDGFGLLLPDDSMEISPDKASLAQRLAAWVGVRLRGKLQ